MIAKSTFAGFLWTTSTGATGLRFDTVSGLSWPGILEASARKEFDLIPNIVRSPERESFLQFSVPYLRTPLIIVTHKDAPPISGNGDLKHRSVGLIASYASSQRVLAENPEIIPPYFASTLEAIISVSLGNTDAFVGKMGTTDYLAQAHGITKLTIAGAYDSHGFEQYMGIRDDWPELLSIINKAVVRIDLRTETEILRRWVPMFPRETAATQGYASRFRSEMCAFLTKNKLA